MNVDLPNLTSLINSNGWSFYNTRSVTLESISEYWTLIVFRYSKSSKGQSTWFIRVYSVTINFEYWLFDWFDFIYRCFFHSRWSCTNRKWFHIYWFWFWFWFLFWYLFWFWVVILALDLYIPFNAHCIINAFLLCLFQIPSYHSLVIDLGVNYRFTLFHYHYQNWLNWPVSISPWNNRNMRS